MFYAVSKDFTLTYKVDHMKNVAPFLDPKKKDFINYFNCFSNSLLLNCRSTNLLCISACDVYI